MTKPKFTSRKAPAQDTDPATLAQQKLHERLRQGVARNLLKRRRRKSHQ